MNGENPTIQVRVGSTRPEPGLPEPALEDRERTVQAFTPPIDIHEGPEGLVLEADLPGAVGRTCGSSSRTTFSPSMPGSTRPRPKVLACCTRSIASAIISVRSSSATRSIATGSRRS